jgi:UDP-N-acetylmuramoyl-L-alanyl-D-glutamate--2,6-diaminopimelate ligase
MYPPFKGGYLMSMTLKTLLNKIVEIGSDELSNVLILSLTDDSRKVTAGTLFFAIPGTIQNGSLYIKDALSKGAVAVISETEFEDRRHIKVNNIKQVRFLASQAFYDHPYTRLNFFGVTGTNGKTTTAVILHKILNSMQPSGLLGTIGNFIGGKFLPTALTTPGLIQLTELSAVALGANDKNIVMEVSSHAIDQGRIEGIAYTSAIFTNLSQDHLDYHLDMESYYQAKKKLFSTLATEGVAIINTSGEWGTRLFAELKGRKLRVSVSDPSADYFAHLVDQTSMGMLLEIREKSQTQLLEVSLSGSFNIENTLCAVAAAREAGVSWDIISAALKDVAVPGRMECVYNDQNRRVFVDYAHTPDALERVLTSARKFSKGQLISVFGCGGDRDRTKRPLMGKIAVANSDQTILTSDNPRTEDPLQIIQDVLAGNSPELINVIPDRREAICNACNLLQEEDVLVIAGKGHEDYQIIGTNKIHFDDREEVRKFMEGHQWN